MTVAPRRPRGDRRRLVAGANGRPPPRHARALGATAEAEARTPLGDRGRRADRGRHRLSRAVRPGQAAASSSPGSWRRSSACLLLGPLAIRIFSGVAGRVSIAPRLALRDLVRYQARSGAALAAVTLALGIAATIVVVASAEEAKRAAEPPNLSDRQIRVYLGPAEARELIPPDAPAQAARPPRARASAARRASSTRATVIPLRKAVQPGATPIVVGGTRVFAPASRSSRPARRYPAAEATAPSRQLYVATPAVLALPRNRSRHGRSAAPTSSPTAASGPTGSSSRASRSRREMPPSRTSRRSTSADTSSAPTARRRPPTFITLNGLRRHGWKQIPAGWLVESSRPLTSDQIADAREVAANAGLTIEVQQRKRTPSRRRWPSRPPRARILALAILAMTVGLIRGESAGDLRTLTATGATARHPPHADRHHRRRARPPRRAPRRRRRLRRPHRDVLRRPRLPAATCRPSTSPSRSSACRWRPPRPAGSLAGREPPAIARRVIE